MTSTALTTLLETAPQQAYALKIQQVVTLCDDGKLRDDTECERQFRKFLETAPSDQLSLYAAECLSSPFTNSGLVLQDVINELGRRLDYRVENGLYQGRVNQIGYDGIWSDPHAAIIVEVKTTDAYRISLDTVIGYRDRLIGEGRVPKDSSVLIIVGREDTGDLEAQVRGSKHAWSIRLISVEALTKLVAIKERTEDPTIRKIHDLLVPFEYTKLDQIIDVVFDVSEDATAIQQTSAPASVDEIASGSIIPALESAEVSDPIEVTRQRIVTAISHKYRPIVKKSGALYWTTDKQLRVAIGVSSHYESRSWPYWYAYHPQWDAFLKDGTTGFYVLGCTDLDVAFAIPLERIHGWLNRLRTTTKGARMYWHVDLEAGTSDAGKAFLRLVDPRENQPVNEFALPLNSHQQ